MGAAECKDACQSRQCMSTPTMEATDAKSAQQLGLKEYVFSSGIKYYGTWMDRKRHGYGRQMWPDGSCYAGEWVNDQQNGQGRFTQGNGKHYDGGWLEDQAHGHGVFTDSDGSVYKASGRVTSTMARAR